MQLELEQVHGGYLLCYCPGVLIGNYRCPGGRLSSMVLVTSRELELGAVGKVVSLLEKLDVRSVHN